MAYVTTAIGAEEYTPKAADKPLFLGRNILEAYNAAPVWRRTTSSSGGVWGTGSDVTDASGPTRYGFDGFSHLRTYPTLGGSATEYTYLLDLTEGSTADLSFDTVVILNHNFHLLTPSSPSVKVELSNASDFGASQGDPTASTAYRLAVASFTPTTASRLVAYAVNRYTQCRYLRLRITSASTAFTTTAPAFGELILARRRQMGVWPDLPWDPKHLVADVTDFRAQSGFASRYVRSRGQRVLTPTFRCGGTDTALGLNTETEIRALWASVKQGTKPFIMVPQPYSAPNDAILVHADPPDLTVEQLGPNERLFSMTLREQAPYRQIETE